MDIRILVAAAGLSLMIGVAPASGQATSEKLTPERGPESASTTAVGTAATPKYVIGPDDVLQIVFWREKDLSGEVIVRSDGRISLPLLNDVVAAGRTPEELRDALIAGASPFLAEPNATVVVKESRSRKVFITGSVERPGPYVLTGRTTVLQLIAMAGGLKEFADQKNIVVMRGGNGRQVSYAVDYRSILRRQNLEQNFDLAPGDTVLVP
jgi:polysaccharide export outer membrane protein